MKTDCRKKSAYMGRGAFALLLAFSLMGNVFALNLSFLAQSPVANLTKQDWQIINYASIRALNFSKDGTATAWRNRQTGAFGYFIPSHTVKVNGVLCRDLTIYMNTHGYSDRSTYTFCRLGGEWKTS